jgi:hypothetical protein
MTKLTIKIRLAWWVPVYVSALYVLCWALDREPNPRRVTYWVTRGTTLSIEASE